MSSRAELQVWVTGTDTETGLALKHLQRSHPSGYSKSHPPPGVAGERASRCGAPGPTVSVPGVNWATVTCDEDVCRLLQLWPLPIAAFSGCSQGTITEAKPGTRALQGSLP